jgi:DNA polymerase delta subunit 1
MDRERLYREFHDAVGAAKHKDDDGTHGTDLTFQVLSWYVADLDDEVMKSVYDDDDDEIGSKSAYVLKMFGVTRMGRSVAATVIGFAPYFYVRLPDAFRHNPRVVEKALRDTAAREYGCCRRKAGSLLDVATVRRKNFWGFRNGERETFMRLTFKRQSAMRGMANYLAKNAVSVRGGGAPVRFELFESNIDPLLRFVHELDIQAAGWVRIPHRVARESSRCDAVPVTAHVAHDVRVQWTDVHPVKDREDVAPLLVAAFDIESNSSHGDFSVAVKVYKRTASEIVRFYDTYLTHPSCPMTEYDAKRALRKCVLRATHKDDANNSKEEQEEDRAVEEHVSQVFFKRKPGDGDPRRGITEDKIACVVDDAYSILCGKCPDVKKSARISVIADIFSSCGFPELEGDEIIQIGTTFHIYGQSDCCYRHILTLGSCDPVSNGDCEGGMTETVSCVNEHDLLVEWVAMINRLDPDVVTGYNIFGFDMSYMYARSKELGRATERAFLRLGRLADVSGEYKEANLSSSALGDNVLKYVDMQGRTLMDLMKIVQRDYKLDSYKLDNVAHHFTKKKKHDITAADIFRLQRGSAEDRRIVAEYCLQDCALCNRLVMKLEVVANNLGMANVCSVPLSYIFMRGQGVKIFSLVARQCRVDDFVIPVVRKTFKEDEATPQEIAEQKKLESYEGAIVLEPRAGMYLDDPVTVLDYASLYPSSMISENISHDCLVMDPRYAEMPGVEYENITYDTPDGPHTCKFAQLAEKGVLPRILQQLLRARKATRKKIPLQVVRLPPGYSTDTSTTEERVGLWDPETRTFTDHATGGRVTLDPDDDIDVVQVRPLYNDFQKAVLDGLQNAYKVTANSLYGQMGAATSPLYLKHVAACTTATGRSLILRAKQFMEYRFNVQVVYGDTDSLFMIFDLRDADGNKLHGKPALVRSIEMAHEASRAFKPHLKAPHDLEYDKTFWPFVIFSKKRYVGNLYEDDVDKCKRKEMGIVLKRRDNAQIVKHIYGGIIDIVLNDCNIPASVEFLRHSLQDLVDLRTPHQQLVVTKTLAGTYKDPEHQAHYVLAQRIGEREPGNKPQTNDRIPYIYVKTPASASVGGGGKKNKAVLQGDRIEDPGYVEKHGLRPDVGHYITNQIMKPVLQLYSIVLEKIDGYRPRAPGYWAALKLELLEKYGGDAKKARDKYDSLREAEVKVLLFDPWLRRLEATSEDERARITHFFAATKSTDPAGGRKRPKPAPPPAPAPPPKRQARQTKISAPTTTTTATRSIKSTNKPKEQVQTTISSLFAGKGEKRGRGGGASSSSAAAAVRKIKEDCCEQGDSRRRDAEERAMERARTAFRTSTPLMSDSSASS